MILRCTAKILTLLATRPAELATPPASDDDWYLNVLWIERRKCPLLTHAGRPMSFIMQVDFGGRAGGGALAIIATLARRSAR